LMESMMRDSDEGGLGWDPCRACDGVRRLL
jgi:hypothetical protein